MRIAVIYFTIGALLAAGAMTLMVLQKQSLRDDLLLNLGAEFLGVFFGSLLASGAAYIAAKERLNRLAPRIVALIRELRVGDSISQKAARGAVICTASIISGRHLEKARYPATAEVECDVCALNADTDLLSNRCTHCGLAESQWKLSSLAKLR